MEKEAKRTVLIIVVSLFIFSAGVVSLGTRYKTVAMSEKVLLIERWTGRAFFIYSDGSKNTVESIRSLRGPLLTSKISPSYASVQFRGKVKWRSGKTYVLVMAQPYNDVLKGARKNRKRQLVVDLMDRDGFVVKTLWIPVSKMSSVENGEGKIVSLEYRAAFSMCMQDFRAIKSWKVR